MPYLAESNPPVFPTQVWELTTDDDVLGGAGGTANRQPKELTERTNWLKYYLNLAQQAIVALQNAFAGMLVRLSSLESLLTPDRVNNITNINDASLLTTGTLANARLSPEIQNSVKIQSVTVRPNDTQLEINFFLGGVVLIELQNTAPCALSFVNASAGQSGELYFTSIFGQNRVIQLPAASPKWEVAFPDTRTLTVSTMRGVAYRVLSPTLIRASVLRDFS